jgi:hypothetical protein
MDSKRVTGVQSTFADGRRTSETGQGIGFALRLEQSVAVSICNSGQAAHSEDSVRLDTRRPSRQDARGSPLFERLVPGFAGRG